MVHAAAECMCVPEQQCSAPCFLVLTRHTRVSSMCTHCFVIIGLCDSGKYIHC